jgi:hypothetical protein
VINYEVDKAMYKAYQILTPLQKIAIQDLTKLHRLNQIQSIILYYYQKIII